MRGHLGPELEHVRLSGRMEMSFFKVVANEARSDLVGRRARAILTKTLVEVAEDGGWCGCAEHEEAVSKTAAMLWQQSAP